MYIKILDGLAKPHCLTVCEGFWDRTSFFLLLEGDALNIVQRINSDEPFLSIIVKLKSWNQIPACQLMVMNKIFLLTSCLNLSPEVSAVWFVNFPKKVIDAALVDLS